MSITGLDIIVGTYEEFLLGYQLKEENEKFSLVQSFADHSHLASIRSVCQRGRYVASGSADETITLYDMNSRTETGKLVQHNGTVNCLSFSPNASHLLSGSDDGSIAVFQSGSWQLEKVFSKAHNGQAVTHLSIHPSGKLALSVGTDATLRTWNLLKGRQAYVTNLGKNRTGSGHSVTCLLWSPDGNKYLIAIGDELNVYDVSSAGIIFRVKIKNKITSVCFTRENEVVIGDEGGGISIHDIGENTPLKTIEAHTNRVKCLSSVIVGKKKYLVSASSNGQIKLWKSKVGKLKEICSVDCGCRITCMTVLDRSELKNNTNEAKQEEVEFISKSEEEEEAVPAKQPRKDSGGNFKTSKSNKNKSENIKSNKSTKVKI